MESFGVLLIAVDDYPAPPGPLPSSNSATRFSEIVTRGRGGQVVEFVTATSREEVLAAFDRWTAPNSERPSSTIVYLVGHGTDDGLDHDFIVPGVGGPQKLRTSTLASFFEADWFRRQADGISWTLFVLDCCAADIGVINLQNALTSKAIKKPRRYSLWPATPRGAAHNGNFVSALDRAITTFTENDAVIPLNELFRRIRSDLGDLEPESYLPDDAVLRNPMRTPTAVVMNLDAHAELRRVIAGLSDDVRSHFLAKAQGAEAGDVAWYFSGRQAEIQALSTWLHDAVSGMRVVTGEAGSGKSAVLGHLFVLSNDSLREAYAASELAPGLFTRTRPPSGCFDAALHLTGRTLSQTVHDLCAQISEPPGLLEHCNAPEDFQRALQTSKRTVTLLADALDEAQEPDSIADFFRQAVASKVARVVIGTRRSLNEGPDRPYDPSRRDLIDALGARDEDLLVIGRDGGATRDYVERRLSAWGSPYTANRPLIESLAARIAAADQPLLFARLATSELLARPPLLPDAPQLDRLLTGGHRGVFVAAVERLRSDDPATVIMLRALALSRGRGVPETGGIWLAIGQALADNVMLSDTVVRKAIERAAPYVLLDAEGEQSVYRLAHRTFVEHFRSEPNVAVEHRKVAVLLRALVDKTGGWEIANHYLVRYLPEHFTADPDRAPVDADGLAALATDAGWLARGVSRLGVDGVVDALASARRSLDIPVVETVERVLRRSRIALSRDPAQLPGQVHARSHNAAEPQLASLGDRLAAHSGTPWLRMRYGAMDWQADLETTYGLVGKVRALAFGQIDGHPVVAIGIDDSIRLWDPRHGNGYKRVFGNDGRRVTALALSHLDGRPVVIAVSSYDQVAVLRDARTGAVIGPQLVVRDYVRSIALGLLGDRVAVAASVNGSLTAWDARTGESLTGLPTSITEASVHGVSELESRLVAHVVRQNGFQFDAWVVDIATGVDVWPRPQRLSEIPTLLAAFQGRSGFVVAATMGFSGSVIRTWLPAAPGDFVSPERSPSIAVRALAVGEVQGVPVVAHAPDYDSTALVSLSVPLSPSESKPPGQRAPRMHSQLQHSRIQGVFTVNINESGGSIAPRIAVLTDSPLAVVPLLEGEAIDRALDKETVTFALTGMSRSDIDFVAASDSGLAEPPPLTKGASSDASFRLDEPAVWPRSAQCRGVVAEHSVIATGSIRGSVWIWDASTQAVIAGPFTEVPTHKGAKAWSRRILRMKGGPSLTSSVALGRHPHHGDVLAVAHDGSVRLVSVPSGDAIATPAKDATVVTAVALGRLLGEQVLVTGSQGGVVVVWALGSDKRITALTIDSSVEKVWVVRGADAIAVETTHKGERALFILDVRIG